ncbi:MAG: hypothetical protein J6A01_06075, partial [Proteobacteria bacterium]|nr:hypothetical protein [Pseudomonadota bacterium]
MRHKLFKEKSSRVCLAISCLVLSSIGIGGCEWDNKLYDEFVMPDSPSGVQITFCEGMEYIVDNNSPTHKCEKGQTDDEICKVYAHAFEQEICPKYFRCEVDAKGIKYCDPSTKCNGDHVQSCDNNTIVCKDGFDNCNGEALDGCEIDLSNDSKNCGECGNACKSNQSCENRKCVDRKCSTGLHLVGTTCVEDDINNCGREGMDCTRLPGWAQGTCEKAQCVYDSCTDNYHLAGSKCIADSNDWCGNHEECYELDAKGTNKYVDNSDHCGCNTAQGYTCELGECIISQCHNGMKECYGECIDFSATHVISCDEETLECASDYLDCDGQVTNGCEIYSLNDNEHCGSCDEENAKCNEGEMCSGGQCLLSCQYGLTDCGGTCVDLYAGNAESCDGTLLTCKEGFADCDQNVANGCEVNTTTSNQYCGAKG